MPVSFGPRVAVVTGGQRARRFIRNTPTDGASYARAFARLFPIQRFRDALPHRTGRLARSIRLVVRGSTVSIFGEFYGRFQPGVSAAWEALAVETIRRSGWLRP